MYYAISIVGGFMTQHRQPKVPDLSAVSLDDILYKLEVAELYKQLLETPLFSQELEDSPAAAQVTEEIRAFVVERLCSLLGVSPSSVPQVFNEATTSVPQLDTNNAANSVGKLRKTSSLRQPSKSSVAVKPTRSPKSNHVQLIKRSEGQIPMPTSGQLTAHYHRAASTTGAPVDDQAQLMQILANHYLSQAQKQQTENEGE